VQELGQICQLHGLLRSGGDFLSFSANGYTRQSSADKDFGISILLCPIWVYDFTLLPTDTLNSVRSGTL
jgi:hypothetical protein